MAVAVELLYNDYADPKLGASLLATPDQDAAYPAINALHRGRNVYWSSPGASVPKNYDIDLGQNRSIGGVGLCNVQGASLFGTTSVYLSTDGISWGSAVASFASTLFLAQPDGILSLGASFTRQYVRIQFNWAAFTCGKIMVGTYYHADTTTGAVNVSAGSRSSRVRPTVRNRMMSGAPSIQDLGPSRYQLALAWQNAPATVRQHIEALAASQRPFMVRDWIGRTHHAELQNDRVDVDIVWGSPDLFNVRLEAEQLV